MGVRGIIRDVVGLYVGFKLIESLWTGTPDITSLVIYGLIVGGISVWFVLERIFKK